MFRRVFTASFAAANNTTPSSPSPSSSNNNTTAAATRGVASLAPRPDVDISEQKRLVARDKAERKAKLLAKEKSCSLYGALAPQEEARVMEFNRHSLRLLVLEAHNRQVQQTRSPNSSFDGATAAEPTTSSPNSPSDEAVSPTSSTSSSGASSSTSGVQQRRGAVTPPPEGHFDLTQRSNVANLLQDIDTLMAVAQQKPPQTRDRILNQTYEQVARLSLWNDLA